MYRISDLSVDDLRALEEMIEAKMSEFKGRSGGIGSFMVDYRRLLEKVKDAQLEE